MGSQEFDFHVEVTDKTVGGGTRIDNGPYNLLHDLNGEHTLEQLLQFLKASLMTISREVLIEEQAKGFDKNPLVVVDGNKNKPIDLVKPLGKIEFIDSRISSVDIILEIAKKIESTSKVVTGTYLKGNFVFFNGDLVATDVSEVKAWLDTNPKIEKGSIVRFVNVVPYARKLERTGVTAGSTNVKFVKSKDKLKRGGNYILASNGVYYLASRSAVKNYKHNVDIKFRYEFGTTLGIQQYDVLSPRTGKKMRREFATPKGVRKTKRNSGPYLYPTIKLTFNERGTI